MKLHIDRPIRIGIFGGAFDWNRNAEKSAAAIGTYIAKNKCSAVTGATTGLPYVAGKSAMEHGAFVLGISPAHDINEHTQKYKKPTDGCSVIIWTGSGYTGRNYLNIRNCDGAIFIGGETGTLEEFCIANYEGKVIGALEGSGGVSDKIREIMSVSPTDHGAVIIYDTDPKRLFRSVLQELKKR